jgi:hypothetical protein
VKHALSNKPLPEGGEGFTGTSIVAERAGDARYKPIHPELETLPSFGEEGTRVPQDQEGSLRAAGVC